MGLIGDAPGVGIYRETKATALRSKTMPANAARSVGSVPKSREEIPLPTANQTTPPTAIARNAWAQPLRYDASLLCHRRGA